jgi:hypothetical protein
MSSAVANSTVLRPLTHMGETRPWSSCATSWFTAKPIDQRYGD